MNKPTKKLIILYSLGIVLSIFFAFIFNVFKSPDVETTFMRLTDTFTASGTILTFIGLMNYALNVGLFDGVVFTTKKFLNIKDGDIIPGTFSESYSYYREKKSEERVSSKPVIVAGCTFLMFALIFLCIYYMVI